MAAELTHVSRRAPRRRANQTRRFLKIAVSTMQTVDGVRVAGCRGSYHIGSGYRCTIAEDDQSRRPYWWLWGNGIDPVEVVDPVDAVAVLRTRKLIPAKAS